MVLIVRGLDHSIFFEEKEYVRCIATSKEMVSKEEKRNRERNTRRKALMYCLVLRVQTFRRKENPVTIARRIHPFPCRTRKLSSLTSMVLGGRLPGRVDSCRNLRPVGQEVKTRPFHGCNASSILARVTIKVKQPF